MTMNFWSFPLFMRIVVYSLSTAFVLWWPIPKNNMDPDQTAPLGAV